MRSTAVVFLLMTLSMPAFAQDNASILERVATVELQPAALTLQVGEKAKLTATVKDKDGAVVTAPVIYVSRGRRNLTVLPNGEVEALRPGTVTVVAMVPADPDADARNADQEGVRAEMTVTIPTPAITRIDVRNLPARLYAGTTVRLEADLVDRTNTIRYDVPLTLSAGNSTAVRVDRFNQITGLAPGRVTLVAQAEDVRQELQLQVVANPVRSFEVKPSQPTARTGDVIRFDVVARDASGNAVTDLPVTFGIQAHSMAGNPGAPATAQIAPLGRFVAEEPGMYTVVAIAGDLSHSATVDITERDVQQRIEVVGHAPVRDRHTSDLWVWEGVDGRDYAITGTWGADGHAYFWDVTEPKSMVLVDTVRVDARTVNDVKISEDGRIAVISREGASDRKNGIVLLDVSNPRDGVTVLSRFDEELTGGVHNVFVYQNHVYAVNNGRKYDIINISEPKLPYRVGSYELDTPGHSIHDVWVVDGIAYSSNWQDGVHMVDVGNGVAGGTPEKPVLIGKYADPKGRNHAAFPYKSAGTGKFYVIMGDEIFPYGNPPEGAPELAAGYLHIVDFTDPKKPVEVARYEVPEAGTHNLWVEGDKLFVAYYNGGVRVVDLSGDLMGDLYKQGREIAWFKPQDPQGHIRNAAMVWGAQPHKGLIYMSDHNSGLWAVRLVPREARGSQQ